MTLRDASSMLLPPGWIGPPTLIGGLGGLTFLFVFPKGSITTLMHDVLHMPGPGAGIALLLGPAVLLSSLVSSHLVRREQGGALLAALVFSVAYAMTAKILALPTSSNGRFGSIRFVAALAVCGATAEVLLFLTRCLRPPYRFLVSACAANAALLLFYWIAIFPRTKGWIAPEDVPLLLVLIFAGGAVAGFIGWAVGTRILDPSGRFSRRQDDVRTG